MKRPNLLSVIAALAVLGFADAWYLADTALTGGQLTCNIAGLSGCNVVAQSAYSHFFGIPLGVYGVVFYTLFLLLTAFTFWKPLRRLDLLLATSGVVGALVSLYFLYVQIVLIKALCVYCLGSAAIAFLLLAAVLWLARPAVNPGPTSVPTSS